MDPNPAANEATPPGDETNSGAAATPVPPPLVPPQHVQPPIPAQPIPGQPMWPPMPGAVPYGSYPPPQPPQTNGFAIVALITGLMGMCLLAVPFGFIALSQIKSRGQQGKGMAIAGIALSAVWALVVAGAFTVAAVIDPSPSSVGSGPRTTATESGYVLMKNMKAGDCVNGVKEDSVISGARVVDCALPHDAEMFYTFSLTTWQGEEQTEELVLTRCGEVMDRIRADKPNLTWIWYDPDTESEWRDDPTIQCFVLDPDGGKLTGRLSR